MNMKSAILLPPLSFLKNSPFVSMFSGAVEKNVMVTYPISLYRRDITGRIEWLGFIYTFLYTAKDGKKVAHLAYPLSFGDVYERLLKEAEELATAFKASRIEYEGYRNVTGHMMYPVSGFRFGNNVSSDFIDFLKDNGFTEKETRYCYEISSLLADSHDILTYTIPDFHERRHRYLEMCRVSDSFPQLFDMGIYDYPDVFENRYLREEWVIFTESGEQKGAVRWLPQSLFGGKGGKVVRLLFFNATPQFMSASLSKALRRMPLNVQIADIPRGNPLQKVVEDLGGVPVYETVHLVKLL